MKKVYDENAILDQKLNIGSAKELSRLLLVSTDIEVPCIANALEKLLEPLESFFENLAMGD